MITAANMNQMYAQPGQMASTPAAPTMDKAYAAPAVGMVAPAANTMNAAWDGQFWDDEKLKAAVAAQGQGNNIANDASWMQALNPLSGIKLDQAGRAAYTQYGDTDQEIAATQNTYKDALGRSYQTVAGAEGDPSTYIQFTDKNGSGFANPTGSDRDRVAPIYKLNADGTATPHSANTQYREGAWSRDGQELATWAAIMATAGIGGAALEAGAAGAGGAGGTGEAVLAGGGTSGVNTAATNAALIESGGGTAGYGASSAGMGGGAGTLSTSGSLAAGATPYATTAAGGTTAGSTLPAWATKAGTGALTSAAGTALQGGNGSQILNSAVGGAVNGGTGTNLGGAVTGALNGSGSGTGGSGGTSGGSAWDQFLQGLSGGSGGSTDWGSILNSLGTGYAAYDAGRKATNAYDNQIKDINGLYAPDSAYAKQMEQTLARKDAAAGRNSQYGTRAVELAANLTDSKSKAINSANMTQLLGNKINAQNQFPASLVSLMQGKGGQQALSGLGGLVGQGASAIGSGVSSGYNWLANLYNGYSGTADPSIGPVDYTGTANPNIGPQQEPGPQGDPYQGYFDEDGNWIEG